jgi:hypothetical protein
MSEGYKPTEPDDLTVCLSLMDEHWPGYQNAKGIIRDHVVRMRTELRRQSQELERAREAYHIALQAVKFCAKWGGRSGRIPDPQPGSKHWHAKNALDVLKKLGLYSLAAPAQPAQKQGEDCD